MLYENTQLNYVQYLMHIKLVLRVYVSCLFFESIGTRSFFSELFFCLLINNNTFELI